MELSSKFDAKGTSANAMLDAAGRRAGVMAKVWEKFWSWFNSAERKALVKKASRIPIIPHNSWLIIDWPPNTGDPKLDKKILEEVRKDLAMALPRVIVTPEGQLKLKGGKVALVERKGRVRKRASQQLVERQN